MATKRKTAAKSTPKPRKSRSARRSGDKPPIIYVHGIGGQPPEDELKLKWDLALFGKGMGDRTCVAYWADVLPRKAKRKRTKSAAKKLDAVTLLEEANVDPSDERAREFVEAMAAYLAEPEGSSDARRGLRTKALPLPRFLRREIAERLLRWFVRDSAAYFFNTEVRRRIMDRLKAKIPKSGEPFILISHSQGTIISFEVLWKLKDRPEASLFVTMGSPLGVREFQDLVEADGFALEVPPGVRAWHNFADRLDPVALDATLSPEFKPDGKIRDHLVVNERTKDLLRLNPHSSVGYLASPEVRSVVHHAMGFDSAGRFLVARDVAEEFVGVDERQPVLIEVLHPGYWALGEDREQRVQREARQGEKLSHLSGRIEELRDEIKKKLGKKADEAKVQALRKYVAAHLTPEEISWLAREHAELNVYAVWRSSEKRKLVDRSLAPIKVDAARRSYLAEGAGITWAVLDTGARFDHPHFNGPDGKKTILEVLDCTTHSDAPGKVEDPEEADPDGHGTHVAGIIAGEHEDRGRPIRGIAPRARLLVYKVLDDHGMGEDAWIIKAIDDIFRRNSTGAGLLIHGVNLSLGGPFDASVYGCGHSPICSDLRDLWRQGVLVCVAAGNEGRIQVETVEGRFDLNTQLSIGDPANLEDSIAVGSVNADKPHLYGTSYFSSRGPTADGRAKPDVVAPGERILSANSAFRKRGRGFVELYRHDSGTSMACPHVSGMLAAFLSVRREFRGRPDEVKRILMENCNDLGRDRYHQGAGLPNLMKMLLNT